MKYKTTINLLLVAAFLGIFPAGAHAANFLLDKNVVGTGRQEINILINTENQEINTVSASLTLSSDNIVLEDVSDASSLVNLWIEKPSLSKNTIRFAGIVPGGYSGSRGQLVKVYLTVTGNGEASFSLDDATALLNDGLGTEATINKAGLKFKSSILIATTTPGRTAAIPPENFSPIIISDPNIHSGKNVLIFSTTDKSSGVDHYEVLETGLDNVGAWKNAESPYLLEDQKIRGDIYVRAVSKDKSFIVVKIPKSTSPTNKLFINYSLFSVLIVLLLLVVGIIIYRRRKASR